MLSQNDSFKPSDAGFLLLDSSLVPVYANQDAVRILSYPRIPQTAHAASKVIKKRVCSLLSGRLPSQGAPSVVEFLSHKWRYLARVFYVDSYGDGPFQASYAIVLERGHHVTTELAQISAQYGLTNREKETMRLLVDGLTSKELASRMKISPNTVKVFLRLIMMKMGLTTRAGIIGKIVSRQ